MTGGPKRNPLLQRAIADVGDARTLDGVDLLERGGPAPRFSNIRSPAPSRIGTTEML
jgi:hypothetical protein